LDRKLKRARGLRVSVILKLGRRISKKKIFYRRTLWKKKKKPWYPWARHRQLRKKAWCSSQIAGGGSGEWRNVSRKLNEEKTRAVGRLDAKV